MRRRYVAVWSPTRLTPDRRAQLDRLTRIPGQLAPVIATKNLVIIGEPELSTLLAGSVILLGSIFAKGPSARKPSFDDRDVQKILASGGRWLVDNFWGNYLAILQADDGAFDVVRAPFGDLGCYYVRDCNGWCIASDAALMQEGGIEQFRIDSAAVARALGRGEIVGPETCLAGIAEVRGGDRWTGRARHQSRSSSLWSPWSFANKALDDGEEAAIQLRGTVQETVDASVSACDHVLLMLSGGLDSSVVSACLKTSGPRLSCMTLVTDDRAGDERSYARLAANAADSELFEINRNPQAVDMCHSASAILPRPTARSFTQESEESSAELARRLGAQAIVDGGGGDNIFCSHRSVAAAADCLLTSGIGARFWRTTNALGGLNDAGLPTVIARSMRRAWLRPRATTLPFDTALMSPSAAEVARGQPDHPWLSAPPGALPGKSVHIALLAVAQAVVESTYPAERIPRLSPLLTQPVVELCLRIPSWHWFGPGRDRAMARRAFSADLPAELINRRSKGSPNRFAASLIERHRQTLRSLLFDGVLAGDGLLNMDSVRAMLNDAAPARSFLFTRLLRLADVEAWARHWS